MRRERVSADCRGLTCSGVVITGDWEGDASVPNGTREIPPYVDDVQAYAGKVEIYELLSQGVQDDICDALIESHAG